MDVELSFLEPLLFDYVKRSGNNVSYTLLLITRATRYDIVYTCVSSNTGDHHNNKRHHMTNKNTNQRKIEHMRNITPIGEMTTKKLGKEVTVNKKKNLENK